MYEKVEEVMVLGKFPFLDWFQYVVVLVSAQVNVLAHADFHKIHLFWLRLY